MRGISLSLSLYKYFFFFLLLLSSLNSFKTNYCAHRRQACLFRARYRFSPRTEKFEPRFANRSGKKDLGSRNSQIPRDRGPIGFPEYLYVFELLEASQLQKLIFFFFFLHDNMWPQHAASKNKSRNVKKSLRSFSGRAANISVYL